MYHWMRIMSEYSENNQPSWFDFTRRGAILSLPMHLGQGRMNRRRRSTSTFESGGNILTTLLRNSYLHCSDEHDRVYALLSLIPEYADGELRIDYGIPLCDVYVDV